MLAEPGGCDPGQQLTDLMAPAQPVQNEIALLIHASVCPFDRNGHAVCGSGRAHGFIRAKCGFFNRDHAVRALYADQCEGVAFALESYAAGRVVRRDVEQAVNRGDSPDIWIFMMVKTALFQDGQLPCGFPGCTEQGLHNEVASFLYRGHF